MTWMRVFASVVGALIGYVLGRLTHPKKKTVVPDDPTQPAPLDTQCPNCGALPGVFCDVVRAACHGGRIDKSKKANDLQKQAIYGEPKE